MVPCDIRNIIMYSLGNLLTRLITLLQVAANTEELLSFVEDLLTDSTNSLVEVSADILFILLVQPTNIELIQSFQEESVGNDQQWSVSSMCTGLSNSALSKLISLTCADSCEKLNTVIYCVLRCKLQQSRVEGDLLYSETTESSQPALDEDGLTSSVHRVTKALLSTDATRPLILLSLAPENGEDLHVAVSLSSLTQYTSQFKEAPADGDRQNTLHKIFQSLQRTCQSNPHSKKLLDCSLFSKLLLEHNPICDNSWDCLFYIDIKEAKTLLDHAVTNLSPSCAKLAGLLLNRSQLLMQHFLSHSVSKLSGIRVSDLEKYHSSGDTKEVSRIRSYSHLMAEFFKALDSNGTDKCLFQLKRVQMSHAGGGGGMLAKASPEIHVTFA